MALYLIANFISRIAHHDIQPSLFSSSWKTIPGSYIILKGENKMQNKKAWALNFTKHRKVMAV